MKDLELKNAIKCIHNLWYNGDVTENVDHALAMHGHLQVLFNYAEITDTLKENNPDKICLSDIVTWSDK